MSTEPMVRVLRAYQSKDPGKKVLLYAHLEFFGGALEVRNWRLFKVGNQYNVGYPNSPMVVQNKRYAQVIPRTPELQTEVLKVLVEAYETAISCSRRDNYAVQ